jgi:hypothetical protein
MRSDASLIRVFELDQHAFPRWCTKREKARFRHSLG